MRARLYLDEDVIPELARALRAHGHDAISTLEQGRQGQSDEDQIAYATADARALVTANAADFLHLGRTWFFAGRTHAGIIVSFRQYRRDRLGELARTMLTLLARLSAEDLANTVRVLDEFW